jgi:hypothetical protein
VRRAGGQGGRGEWCSVPATSPAVGVCALLVVSLVEGSLRDTLLTLPVCGSCGSAFVNFPSCFSACGLLCCAAGMADCYWICLGHSVGESHARRVVWAVWELFVSYLLVVDCCDYLDCFVQCYTVSCDWTTGWPAVAQSPLCCRQWCLLLVPFQRS